MEATAFLSLCLAPGGTAAGDAGRGGEEDDRGPEAKDAMAAHAPGHKQERIRVLGMS